MNRALALAAILLVSACAGTGGRSTPVDQAKKILEPVLSEKAVVEYRDIKQYPGGVVCGEVNAMSRWGDGAGFQPFIVRGEYASPNPSGDDLAVFCSEDPAGSLQDRLGIGPVNQQNTTLMTVYQQIRQLDGALQQYFADHQAFPTTAEGLQVLLKPTESGTRSGQEGGAAYLQQIPRDPWGRAYIYEKPRQLYGAPSVYRLYTLGRDGAPGGRAEDADIGNWQLPYLDHIEKL